MLLSTRTKFFWIGILYFGEGFPFGLLLDFYPVYFRLHGVSLTQIGLLSLIGLTWTLKWIWAPFVDLWGTRKQWVVSCQLLLTLGLVLSLFMDPFTRESLGLGAPTRDGLCVCDTRHRYRCL
ncbi:MAG: hypothetical protein GKS05_11915 [Nitrospirales bacterium]|nr:hypothetical protein [Nitrospirales bacterium]